MSTPVQTPAQSPRTECRLSAPTFTLAEADTVRSAAKAIDRPVTWFVRRAVLDAAKGIHAAAAANAAKGK